MKPAKEDLMLLRRNLLLLGAAIIGSATILHGNGLYAELARNKLKEAHKSLNEAQRTLVGLRDNQQNLADYSAAYEKLESTHVVGDERRLEWIEALEQIRRRHLVSNFHYLIAPQQTQPPRASLNPGNLVIHYSAMKLQLDLLHEMQLVDFFNALRDSNKGWFQLEGCTLRRSAAVETDAAAYLAAECRGGWITLQKRGPAQ